MASYADGLHVIQIKEEQGKLDSDVWNKIFRELANNRSLESYKDLCRDNKREYTSGDSLRVWNLLLSL